MDAQILKTIKEATANSFKTSLADFCRSILPLCPQLCEGLTVTTAGAAELFDKVPQYQLDPGLQKVKPKASQQQVVALTVIATIAHWSSAILLEQLVFPTYDKIAREVDELLERQALGFQSDIDMLTNQLTNTGMALTPEYHADLPDLAMEMDPSHQSTSSTVDPPPASSETSTNSWKLSKTHTLTTPATAICLRQALRQK
ncbi:hypothetical protein RCL_jg29536.t1 [Rhizophagus clarus]|uniref:Uncharacterized protein n=1 Tax=Rhizophagus clarus TaxID=94130 RepID=A0A8H3KZW2_9GLOM|nr:hypothetical protein RCL_jg29536.t1 [Rhizophagus clarus]